MGTRLLLATLFICWFTTAAVSQQPGVRPAQPAFDRHVIVVSLDGFPAYMLQDPKLPLPVLRRLIREGGVADGMEPVNPTVTWPNHIAMVTGVNGARSGFTGTSWPACLGEGKPLRSEPSKATVLAEPVYEVAHEVGLTTAEVAWPGVFRSTSTDWWFPEEQIHENGIAEKEMVEQGLMSEDDILSFYKWPVTWQDDLATRAAAYIIERHRPNLTLIHLSTTDTVQHEYGARSLPAQVALVLADRLLERILDAIESAGIQKQTTLLVVSDHGHQNYQHVIHPNVLLRQQGLLKGQDSQISCDAWAVSEDGSAMVYVTRDQRRDATLRKVMESLSSVAGVSKVILPDEFGTYGYPKFSLQGRTFDMVLIAASGYMFDGDTTGEVVSDVPAEVTRATHGYLNTDPDMREILVAWGAGVRPGSHTGVVPNVDVAATIAHLLNVTLADIQGVPVRDLLEK